VELPLVFQNEKYACQYNLKISRIHKEYTINKCNQLNICPFLVLGIDPKYGVERSNISTILLFIPRIPD
jgi:hypothetical protein